MSEQQPSNQYQLGATSSDVFVPGRSDTWLPGSPAYLLGQQYEIPRAQPDAQMSNRPGINTGES